MSKLASHMRRPLDWFVVALSLTFLLVGRSLPRHENAVVAVPYDAVPTEVLRFEPVAQSMVPAAKRERNLEFGYVRSDTPVVR